MNFALNPHRLKKAGILGGLGPETGFAFAFNINNKFINQTSVQPDLLLHNLPISEDLERKIVTGQKPSEFKDILLKSVKAFNSTDVDFIAIPCNTVHVFFEELLQVSTKPLINIVDTTVAFCKKNNMRKVAVLGSATTLNNGFFDVNFLKENIELVKPKDADVEELSKLILRIIHGETVLRDKVFVNNLLRDFEKEGVDAVVLACTDLPLFINENNFNLNLPIINTLEILEDEVVAKLF